jgi:hypothetical protein
MKQNKILITAALIAFTMVPSVYAKDKQPRGNVLGDQIKTTIAQLKDERKDLVAERNKEVKSLQEQFKEKISTKVGELKKLIGARVFLNKASVTAKGSNTLTVSDKDGKSVAVNISGSTKIERRFFGKSTFDEILVGHTVNVVGKWNDENHTAIDASMIRDLSIQKRFGVFIGIVKTISGNTLTLETVNRGTQGVTLVSATKITNRKGETIPLSSVVVGHRIRVKGTWDRTNSTVTEVTQLKDYSLPMNPAVTSKPTPVVTPAVTVTPTPAITVTPTASPTPTVTPKPTATPTPSV